MLKPKNRLRGRREPRIIMKHGRSVREGSFQLKYLERGKGNFKVAVVVSKKVTKSAPKRNRIRRRVYESIRTNFDIKDNHALIVSVFGLEVAKMPSDELKHQLNQLFKKAQLLK